jgi:tetratricopeptide (TPR) repeat protein
VNTVLVNFASRLRDQCQQLAAAVKEKPGDADAAANLKATQDQAAALIEKVCAREHLVLAQRIILGDAAADLGRSDLAKTQFEAALKMAESSQDAPAKVKAALIRVRSQLVGLLRREKKYSEALVEVDKLLQETPRAMEPNLERARILTGIAESDPSKYPDAVAAWTKLRLAMVKMPKKPPEYYESVYGAASNLAGQANTTSDAQAAAEARKQSKALLKATLALSPNLSGPEMVARYEQLLSKLPQ